ncbi:hypothetical protein [Aquitalea sp. LB_tupeE]|uniref:hypothetical protein n=1 Tax=Aquitalea sp. LB_tupeE TaxID=2748078 RepID=UPI0015B90BBE|nr:hypothetical protein [Aquitalea sp. LB_tupeE]NWK79559.1 hypothetical protein [Aquitalea sp. LB_tupeE]
MSENLPEDTANYADAPCNCLAPSQMSFEYPSPAGSNHNKAPLTLATTTKSLPTPDQHEMHM